MSEDAPPGLVAGNGVDAPQGLSPEAIDGILADFRAWLQVANPAPPAAPDADAIDLHTLLAQFTALRHEVHLQTRAARAQQDQGTEALRQLGDALAAVQQAQLRTRTDENQARDEALRPLLKVLVDVYDALALAEREVRRVQDALLPLLEEGATPPPSVARDGVPLPAPRPSFWARLFGAHAASSESQAALAAPDDELADQAALQSPATLPPPIAARAQQMLASVLTGYTMSLQRVERALRQQDLEPIATEGEPFDPESMEVIEVVADDQRSGEVVGEVRRGYRWRGRVFRHAQVRVAKS